MAEASTEQLLEQQKANCIFCRIVDGKMDAKKVYEDEKFLGILDIRPATYGHILFLPKEHVPILQLLPQEHIAQLFRLTAQLAKAQREALLCQHVTAFIASGAAAGQQASHLLVHLIPRELGDRLDQLDLAQRTVTQSDTQALGPLFKQASAQVLGHFGKADLLRGAPEHKGEKQRRLDVEPVPASYTIEGQQSPTLSHAREVAPAPAEKAAEPSEHATGSDVQEFSSMNDALQTVLATNLDLRRLIIAEPNLVESYISRSPKLAKLFEGVNIRALSLMLRRQEETKEKPPLAGEMSEEGLFTLIDGNEGLRVWLLEHPEELEQNLHQNPRLQAFFAGTDIKDLARRYQKHKEGKQ